MDTRLKKSKITFTKVLCVFLILLTVGFCTFSAVERVDTVWHSSATKVTLNDALQFDSLGRMEGTVFASQLDNYLMHIDSLAKYESGSKEAYEKEVATNKTAAEYLKKDMIYHIKKDMYRTNKNGVTEGIVGLLELAAAGYLSLDYMEVPSGEVGRYVDFKTEFSGWELEYEDYPDFFVDEPDMYYDGSWDDNHSNNSTVEYYFNSFPADVKKIAEEMGYALVVPINAFIYEDDVDETVMHTTLPYVTSVEGDITFENDTSYMFGFYGITFNDAELQSELYNLPYSTYEGFLNKYEEERDELKNYPSAYFATLRNGKVISTNIKGLTEKSTEYDVMKAIGKCDFQARFKNDSWDIVKSEGLTDIDGFLFDSVEVDSELHIVGIYPHGTDKTEPFHAKLGKEYQHNFLMMKKAIQEMIWIALIGLAICIFFGLILVVKSGRYKKDDEVYMAYLDNMWVEIRVAIDGAIVFFSGWLFLDDLFSLSNSFVAINAVLMTALAVIVAIALLDLILYITRHIKNRDLGKSFMVAWIFNKIIKGIWSFFRKNKEKLKDKIKAAKQKYIYVGDVETEVKRKTLGVVIINIIVGGFALFLMAAENFGFALFIILVLFLFDCYILLRGIRFVGAVKRLFRVTSEIRNGEENAKVDYTAIPDAFHKTADDLMGISDGIKNAVDKAMQNEKMKTELITNVSHDLKTPLTSIINYVDLLQKCDIPDETAQSYLQVLSEKSDRLKHLIEDLVEASKASSGAITVHTVSVSVNEFINQLTGEHSEGLSEKNLNVIVTLPDEDIIVKADSNLLYRVLENLVVNVKKYAMEHTRVYISAQKTGATAKIIIKNISAAPLNMTPEELKSRFVRGDESRSTSGNGLGLSIAENLCNLMKGKLDLSIDGDLFTATVEMPVE